MIKVMNSSKNMDQFSCTCIDVSKTKVIPLSILIAEVTNGYF